MKMNKKLRRDLGIKKARKMVRVLRGYWTHKEWLSEDGSIFKKAINTRKTCSCAFCGNPRKYFGDKSRGEEISEIDMEEQVLDLTN